jgi:hypothetical protein
MKAVLRLIGGYLIIGVVLFGMGYVLYRVFS